MVKTWTPAPAGGRLSPRLGTVPKTIGRLNKAGTLAAPIQFSEVIGPLLAVGETVAVELLTELESKASGMGNGWLEVRDPTAWLAKAAKRKSGGFPPRDGGKGKGWGGKSSGGKGMSWSMVADEILREAKPAPPKEEEKPIRVKMEKKEEDALMDIEDALMDKFQDKLNNATRSFKLAKQDGALTEDSSQYLDDAIQQYNSALEMSKMLQLRQDTADVMLQLAKVHGNRAIATVSFRASHVGQNRQLLADHHLKLTAESLIQYREQAHTLFRQEALPLQNAFDKMDKVATVWQALVRKSDMSLSDRLSLVKSFGIHVLGGEIATYNGPLPRARLAVYTASLYLQQATQHLDGGDTQDLTKPLTEMQKLTLEEFQGCISNPREGCDLPSLRGWKHCYESAIGSSHELRKAQLHSGKVAASKDKDDLVAEYEKWAGLVRFCLQRGRVLIDLAHLHEEFYRIARSHGSKSFKVEASLELGAELLHVHKKTLDFANLGANNELFEMLSCSKDVEMGCFTLHCYAKLQRMIGLTTQARRTHKRVVVEALLSDPEAHDYKTVMKKTWSPTPSLRSRSWFMESRKYLLATEPKEEPIGPQIDAIKQAVDAGLKAFLQHVFAQHPPMNGGALHESVNDAFGANDISRINFLKMLRDYHPDTMPADIASSQRNFYEEISKYFNHFYEKVPHFKGAPQTM